MRRVRLEILIAERLAAWGAVPNVVSEVFVEPTPPGTAAAVVARCRRHLGAEPVAAPAPLDRGIATAETLLDEGGAADAHDPAVRRAMGAALARLVALARPMTAL